MTAEETIRKQEEAFNKHDARAFVSTYAPSAKVLDPAYPEPLQGAEAIEKDMGGFFAAFADVEARVTKVVTNGTSYAFEAACKATHTGPLETPTGLVPATNRRVEWQFGVFGTLDGAGKIVDERRYYDMAGQMAQLGLMQ